MTGGGMAAALAGVACVAGGAWAGLDAARQVNPIYTLASPQRPGVIAVTRPDPLPWDAAERPIAAAPSRSLIAEQTAGPAERAFFDLGVAEERDRPEPATVHIRRGAAMDDVAVASDEADEPADGEVNQDVNS